MEGVEGVEELFLKSLFCFHELNVVNEQDINIAIAALEIGDRVVTNSVHVLIQESFSGDVSHLVVAVVLENVMSDGM